MRSGEDGVKLADQLKNIIQLWNQPAIADDIHTAIGGGGLLLHVIPGGLCGKPHNFSAQL